MTLIQARKLKVGDVVRWPEGANGCKESIGIVTLDPRHDSLFVLWPDTPDQRTYLHDKDAVKYIEAV